MSVHEAVVGDLQRLFRILIDDKVIGSTDDGTRFTALEINTLLNAASRTFFSILSTSGHDTFRASKSAVLLKDNLEVLFGSIGSISFVTLGDNKGSATNNDTGVIIPHGIKSAVLRSQTPMVYVLNALDGGSSSLGYYRKLHSEMQFWIHGFSTSSVVDLSETVYSSIAVIGWLSDLYSNAVVYKALALAEKSDSIRQSAFEIDYQREVSSILGAITRPKQVVDVYEDYHGHH